MANQVFANGMEVSCKAADGKSVACFPDVCFTPPQTPATPPGVPLPYPNTGLAKDTTKGSRSVKISGKEVMLKNKSYFKTSYGDEPGCAPKKGVITSKNKGKVYFKKWSMNVKIEGENAVRMMDLTTHNHGAEPGNTLPWPYVDDAAADVSGACGGENGDIAKEKKACADYKPHKKDGLDVCAKAGLSEAFSRNKDLINQRTKSANANPCAAARRCRLLPYDAEPRDGINGCCLSQTGDHIIPKSSFYKVSVANGAKLDGWKDYNKDKAPCMCLEGGSCSGSHGLRHKHHKAFSTVPAGTQRPFEDELKHCAEGAATVSGCDQGCIEAQLKAGHKDLGNQNKPIKHSPTGKNFDGTKKDFNNEVLATRPAAPKLR